MRYSIFPLFFAAVVLIGTGCSKTKDTFGPSLSFKTKKLTQTKVDLGSSSRTTIYHYDSKGRLSSFESNANMYQYNYEPGNIQYTITRSADNFRMYEILIQLNKQGIMESGTGMMYYPNGTTIPFTMAYEYTNGYLTRQTMVQNGTRKLVKDFFYSNNNLSSLKYFDNGKLLYTVNYSYNDNTGNKLNIQLFADFPVPSNGFSGKTSELLWNSAEQVNANGTKLITTKTFKTDGDGYPVSCVYKSGAVVYTENYSFAEVVK
jgi:antitoxin component YwqK of YwqJK toxin-antitoxin module